MPAQTINSCREEEHSMKRYCWLLFDADGTLFDFQRAESCALENTPVQLGMDVPDDYAATYHQINASLWKAFERGTLSARDVRVKRFRLLFAQLGLQGDPIVFSERFLLNLIEATTFMTGAQSLVAQLYPQYHLALLTNGFADVQHARIARLGLADVFHPIVISEEVGMAKPDPAIFDLVLEKMGGAEQSSVLMIGDSLTSDIQGGLNAGLDTCWFNPREAVNETGIEPSFEIRCLSELPARLAQRSLNAPS